MPLKIQQMRQIGEAAEAAANLTTVQFYKDGLMVTAAKLQRNGPALQTSLILVWEQLETSNDPVGMIRQAIIETNRALGPQ